MEPRLIDQAAEREVAPPYADRARRLLTEHAELFRVSPLGISPARPERGPRAPAGRRRTRQLTLPLRPRVLDSGEGAG